MTRLTDFTSQTLYAVICDYGKEGIGSADMTPDTSVVQEHYDEARYYNWPALVWMIHEGVQTDVTHVFEKVYQNWLETRPLTDEWGTEILDKDDRP